MPKKATTAPTETAPEWITRRQAAELLGVDVRTIDRKIKSGEIQSKHPRLVKGRGGIRVVVNRADVDAIATEATA